MGYYDLERWVFNAMMDSYLFWFMPIKAHRLRRTIGNLIFLSQFIAVVWVGVILTMPVDGQILRDVGPIERQTIVNTGRIDSLESQQRDDTKFKVKVADELGAVRLQVGLLDQELSLYRWAIGIIYVVLVGQMGVAVFTMLLRRESERKGLINYPS